jgi:4-hydroxybenzoate polyprenyltransferase
MADRDDDRAIGVRSSALSLGSQAPLVVAVSYALAALALGLAAGLQGCGLITWSLGLLAAAGMQREAALLRHPNLPRSTYGRHFSRQVKLGGLLMLALVLGQMS